MRQPLARYWLGTMGKIPKLAIAILSVSVVVFFATTIFHVPAIHTAIEYPALSKLNAANAESDAKDAMARGDSRLLAIEGYTLEIPGVEMKVDAKYNYRILEGTTDAIKSDKQAVLIKNARVYAEKYNRTLIGAKDNSK